MYNLILPHGDFDHVGSNLNLINNFEANKVIFNNDSYNEIKKLINNEIYKRIKDYSKVKEKMKTYLEIGELLKDVDTKYGKSVIKEYSNRLSIKFDKKYTTSLLYKIKQFYNIIEKVPTLSEKLTWSHWYDMLSFSDINKICYYANQCEINSLDVRSLRDKIKSDERIIVKEYQIV